MEKVQKKFTLKLQIIVCMILIVLSVFFSFMPLATINLKSSEEKISFQQAITSRVGDDSIDIGSLPDSVNITAVKMVQSYRFIFAFLNDPYDSHGGEMYKSKNSGASLIKELIEEGNGNLSKEQKDNIIIGIVVATSFKQIDYYFGDKLNGEYSGTYSQHLPFHIKILSLITILATIFLMAISVILPFIYVIILIKSLVTLIKHKDKLVEYAVPVISGRLPKAAIFPLFYIIIPFLIQRLSFGIGIIFLLLITLLCSVVNAFLGRIDFIGRLKDDNNKNKNIMNINIMQGISVIAFVGFLIFLFSFLQTDLVQTFFRENYFGYLRVVIYAENVGSRIEASHLFYFDGLLMVAMVVILLVVVPIYFTKNLRRFSLSLNTDRHIVLSSFMALVVILPLICAKTELGYVNLKDADNGTFSLLPLTSAQLTNLIISLAGIVIVLAAEIALIILKKKYVWEDLQVVKQTNSAKKSSYSNTLSEYYMKNHTNSKEANKSDTKHI
ncbi:MAG: hypothetical protein IJQ23_01000 [Clostridia bacterium]|nr:hypothetical protein [Clostridia bacterium]